MNAYIGRLSQGVGMYSKWMSALLLALSLFSACGGKGEGPQSYEEGFISVGNVTKYPARVVGWYGEERNQIPEVWIDPGETRQVTDTLPGGTEVHLDLYVDLPGDVMPSTEAVITMNGNMTVVITNASNVVVEYTVTGG